LAGSQRQTQRHNSGMDLPRIFLIAVLAGIVFCLGSALYHLTSTRGDPQKLLRALTVRISLSVGLFLLLFVAWYFGLIHPHGIGG
jgi:cytochrome bd-type quinol oxidase subunit 2